MFGFLYSTYEAKYYYWELIVSLRKVAFAFVSVVLRPIGVDVQATTGLFVLVVCLALQERYAPYEDDLVNKVESLALYTAFGTLLCGVYLYSDNLSLAFKQFFSFLIIGLNVALLIFALYAMKSNVRKIVSMGWSAIAKRFSRNSSRKNSSQSIDKGTAQKRTVSSETSIELVTLQSANPIHKKVVAK